MSPPAALSSPPELGYVGCFKDCAAGLSRDPGCSAADDWGLTFSGVVSTPGSCRSACSTAGAAYFALQSVDMECWCGEAAPPRHARVSDSECDASAGPGEACEGLAHGTCGGRWRNSVYAVSHGAGEPWSRRLSENAAPPAPPVAELRKLTIASAAMSSTLVATLTPASKCIDGSFGTDGTSSPILDVCMTHDSDAQPSLTVTLSAAEEVAYVALYSHPSEVNYQERLAEHSVAYRASSSGAWIECYTGTAPKSAGPFFQPCPHVAEAVRVSLRPLEGEQTIARTLVLTEVEVYSLPFSPSQPPAPPPSPLPPSLVIHCGRTRGFWSEAEKTCPSAVYNKLAAGADSAATAAAAAASEAEKTCVLPQCVTS